MNAAIEQLKTDLSGLPESDRADLAFYLLETLEPEEDEYAEEWRIEIDRRIAELKSGRPVSEPIENVLARLREAYP
jgi:putative addiction module component (TIGR02574 family)